MTLIQAWNSAGWPERVKFLLALARKDPDLLRRTLKRIERNGHASPLTTPLNSPESNDTETMGTPIIAPLV